MHTSEIRRINPLQTLRVFAGISAREFEAVQGLCFEMHFDDGETILREDSHKTDMFVLTRGSVRVETRDETGKLRHLATLEPESVFGEISMILGTPRTATITAQGPARTVRVDGDRYRELRLANNIAALKVANNLLDLVATRQAEINEHLVEIAEHLVVDRPQPSPHQMNALREKLMDQWSM